MHKQAVALASAVALVLLPLSAFAQGPYTDSATAAWFKSLAIPNMVPNCCDQSDCKQVKAEWRGGADGAWWAQPREFPGEWLKVPKDHVINVANPLQNAVLCAVPLGRSDFEVQTEPGLFQVSVYCFVPPPSGY